MSSALQPEAQLASIVKAITDLDDLVRLTLGGLSRAKPWQRQLAAALADVDRRAQVLRMTIVMERSDDELLAASDDLITSCRRAASALGGSRADRLTLTSLRLVTELAEKIRALLKCQDCHLPTS